MNLTIPTKGYIRDYIYHKPELKQNFVGNKLLNIILSNNTYTSYHHQSACKYDAEVVIKVSDDCLRRNSYKLTDKKIAQFNLIMAELIRDLLFEKIKSYMHFDASIKRAIDHAKSELGISDDSFEDDTIRRYYHRHRAKRGLKNIYNKKRAITICNPEIISEAG